MLSMLDVTEPRKRNALSSFFRKYFRPPVISSTEWVDGQPFLRICCEEHEKGPDWRMIYARCLEPSGRLLLPVNIDCPDGIQLRRFTPTRYCRRMLERLALEILVSSPIPPAHRSLALYGREAEVILLLPHLVQLVGELRIITRRPNALSDTVNAIIEQTGMPISMSGELCSNGCNMLLAPSGGAGAMELSGTSIVIAPDHPIGYNGVWVGSFIPTLPPALEQVYTPSYDIMEFCGAFFELTGLGMMVSPRAALVDGRPTSIEELSHSLS